MDPPGTSTEFVDVGPEHQQTRWRQLMMVDAKRNLGREQHFRLIIDIYQIHFLIFNTHKFTMPNFELQQICFDDLKMLGTPLKPIGWSSCFPIRMAISYHIFEHPNHDAPIGREQLTERHQDPSLAITICVQKNVSFFSG